MSERYELSDERLTEIASQIPLRGLDAECKEMAQELIERRAAAAKDAGWQLELAAWLSASLDDPQTCAEFKSLALKYLEWQSAQ